MSVCKQQISDVDKLVWMVYESETVVVYNK